MTLRDELVKLETQEAKLRDETAEAARVQRLFEQSPLSEAFASVEAGLIGAWKASPWPDQEGREKIFAELHALKLVKDKLQTALNRGKIAEADRETVLAKIKRLKARLRA